MKTTKKILSAFVVMMIAIIIAVPAFAAGTNRQSIYLPKDQEWKSAGTDTRTGNYSYVYARCHSVYPDSGADHFTTIQCRVRNSSGIVISDKIYYLEESATGFTSIKIKEGYLSASPVTFQFRGNTSAPAYAVVSYHG